MQKYYCDNDFVKTNYDFNSQAECRLLKLHTAPMILDQINRHL